MDLKRPLISLEVVPCFSSVLWDLVKAAGPTVLSYFFQISIQIINVVYLGQVDKYRMDGIGLGNMWANITGLGVGWGLAGALDTLCSQAHGLGDRKMVSTWTNRGLIVMTAFMIPIAFAWMKTREVLILMGVDPVIATYAYNYLILTLPGLWFFLAFDVIRRFFQAQGHFWPCLWINVQTTSAHIVLCWVFINYLGMLERGAGIATCITYICTFFLSIRLVYIMRLDTHWMSFDMTGFKDQTKYYLKFAIPSAASFILDQINYDITQYEANLLGVNEQSAHIGVINLCSMIFSLVVGLSIATSVSVGRLLGEGNKGIAKAYARAGVLLICVTVLPIISLLFLFRSQVSQGYTYDAEVQLMMSKLLIFAGLFAYIDAVQFVIYGILKGLAKQKEASVAIFTSYYVFALPLGYFLAFHLHWSIYGIWVGMITGACVTLCLMITLLYRARWVAVLSKREEL